MSDEELTSNIKYLLAITLSANVQKLGPAPNDIGDGIKKIMAGDDDCALLALGCYLDDARGKNDWEVVRKLFQEIDAEKGKCST